MKSQVLSLLLLFCATGWAQQQNVRGVVKGPDGGIAKVSVREIDANRRFFHILTYLYHSSLQNAL